MPDPRAKVTQEVTVVVVTWRGRDWVAACLDAIAADHDGRVLVIDNASDDGSAAVLEEHAGIDVVRLPRNRGFAGGVDAALSLVRTPFAALVNDDARIEPGYLAELLRPMADPDGRDIGATTAKLVLPDGKVNNAGSALLPDGYGYDRGLGDPDDGRWDEPADVEAFCGGAAMLRMDAVTSVGGFPGRFFLYYEDTDTSIRLRQAGWRIRYVPSARAVHLHGASSDPTSARFHFFNERNRLLMLVRCFPAGQARHELWRFARSIVGFSRRRLRGVEPSQASERPLLRLRVLASVIRLLPWALRARRRHAAPEGQPTAAS
ncbi:MAG: glycosyltransferase family 2 protein [Acidimicrobiales bacterium]